MKVRFQEYDGKWLYDTKKKELFDIVDNDCYKSKIDMMQLTKFNPFAKLTHTYVINPYRVRK
jgi:hypothetical protein